MGNDVTTKDHPPTSKVKASDMLDLPIVLSMGLE